MLSFWNKENSGNGGCFSTSMNKIPIVESFFFIFLQVKTKGIENSIVTRI